MSSITSYQVVAAMGTLAVLAALNYVGEVGQDYAFVRDITYWLSISGRADEFINGLICSEDLFYFLLIIALFLTLSVLKLRAGRRKSISWENMGNLWRCGFGSFIGRVYFYVTYFESISRFNGNKAQHADENESGHYEANRWQLEDNQLYESAG